MNIIGFSKTQGGPARRIVAACGGVSTAAFLLVLALDLKQWAGAALVICLASLATIVVVIARAKPGRR